MKYKPLRACLFVYVFCFIIWSVYPENELEFDDWYGALYEGDMRFSNEREVEIELNPLSKSEKQQRFTTPYRIEYEGRIPYLRFGENFQEKWLFLHSKNFLFVCKNEEEEFAAFSIGGGKNFADIHPIESEVSSYLVEGDTKYFAENLKTFTPSSPWVEGVEGVGIGEKIMLRSTVSPPDPGYGVGVLIFSNGYVSYDKPYLYEKNARVKRLRITNKLGDYDFYVDIKDTPNPQLIFLPVESLEIELEITDVYPGTGWQDTCINFIWQIKQLIAEKFVESQ